MGSKSKLIAKVTRALAFHRKEIMADKDTIVTDFNSGNYFAAGSVAADVVKVIFGSIEPANFLM